MRILMTGITGFIGRHLALQLQADGHEVIGILRSPNSDPNSPFEFIVADLTGSNVWEHYLPERIDGVIHLAQGNTSRPSDMFAVNVAATDRLTQYAAFAGAQLFCFASTGNVYQPTENWCVEASPLDFDTTNYYALTKIVGEQFARAHRNVIDILTLRIFTPYGTGQHGKMIPRLIDRVRKGEPIVLTNGGQPLLNPIHIDDLVEILRTLVKRTGSQTYNIGGPVSVSIRQLASAIGDCLGIEPNFEERSSDQCVNLLGKCDAIYEAATWTPRAFPYGLREMVDAATAATV